MERLAFKSNNPKSDDRRLMSPMLFDVANTPDKNCSPGLAFMRETLCSPEERQSMAMKF